jgi:hypothetical protein
LNVRFLSGEAHEVAVRGHRATGGSGGRAEAGHLRLWFPRCTLHNSLTTFLSATIDLI